MSNFFEISRRHAIAGLVSTAAVAAAGPALALSPAPTPIARSWARAEALKARMAPHSGAIEAALEDGGTPGWMRIKGAVNALGEERYGLIVEILKATPEAEGDLAIQRLAAVDEDMIHGPRSWALAQRERAAGEWMRRA